MNFHFCCTVFFYKAINEINVQGHMLSGFGCPLEHMQFTVV